MNCVICNISSTDQPFARGGRTIECKACGTYLITGTALHLMNQDLRVYNLGRSREWLAQQREEGIAVPTIEAQTPIWD